MNKRVGLIIGAALYVVALIWSYFMVISPAFSYMGYTFTRPEFIFEIVGVALAVLPSAWMPISTERPSQVVYWLLYVLVLVPAMLIPMYTLPIHSMRLLGFLQVPLLVVFACLGGIYKLRLGRVPRLRIPSTESYWLCVSAVALIFYSIIASSFGLRFHLVSFSDVYDIRSAYEDGLSDTFRFTAYAVSWQGYVINPLFIGYGLVRRNPVMMGLGLLGQIIVYSITGSKSVFLSGIFLLALWFAMRRNGKQFGLITIWGMVVLIVLCTLIDWKTNGIMLTSLFVRRLIITPGLLTGYYFDFFSESPKLLLSHSVFRFIFDYPYDLSPPYMIGYMYFRSASTGANANLWADAYANFGHAGLLVFTGLLATLLWLYDSISIDIDPRLAGMILGIPAFSLANSALLTSILTHGIGAAFLLIYLFPRSTQKALRRAQ